jgi:zinc and cadmium transporter
VEAASVVWSYSLVSVILVSLVSLIGLGFIAVGEGKLKQIIFVMVSLAVGGLFGDAFIHLLPESFERSENKLETSLNILAGIFAFFVLEKLLLWRHQHVFESDHGIRPVGYMNLLADGAHNVIDGMIIGASYQFSLHVGIATTLAVAFHEIPHELGNFFVLLYAGFTKKKALFFNFLSAIFAIFGTLISLLVGSRGENFSRLMLPLAAGGFIYIAGSDLVPELNKELKLSKSIVQMLAIAAGVGMMLLLTVLE